MGAQSRNLHIAWAILLKDLRLELRRKYEIFSMFTFALLSIISFSFSLGPAPSNVLDVIPTSLWVIILFTGIISFTTVFIREMDKGTMDGLRSLPSSPQAIFLGKTFYCFILMGIVEFVLIPASMILFNYSFNSDLALVILTFVLGTFNIALIGSMVSALTMYSESKTILIPLLTFPLIPGSLIPSVTATMKLAFGANLSLILPELRLIVAFLLAILLASWLIFEYVFYE